MEVVGEWKNCRRSVFFLFFFNGAKMGVAPRLGLSWPPVCSLEWTLDSRFGTRSVLYQMMF
jgi:hypothetical protein